MKIIKNTKPVHDSGKQKEAMKQIDDFRERLKKKNINLNELVSMSKSDLK